MVKFSAYLSIYNDWDLLAPALASMRDHIDELIVVDGAYEWMVPYTSKIGLDATRSHQELYDVISDSGIPAVFISGPWKNELEKRRAGYAACSGRYIYRIDADEIIFMHSDALDRFLTSDWAVAEMEVPICDNPDHIQVQSTSEHLPRVGFLFDRDKISADDHLRYLWIVHGPEGLQATDKALPPAYSESIAFNAHLSTWRTPRGATQRASFYIMNWVRQAGFPWIPSLAGQPLDDLSKIFDVLPADQMHSALSRHEIANGHFKITGDSLVEVPLTDEQRRSLRPLYERRALSSITLNEEARAAPQGFLSGSAVCFDTTGVEGRASVLRDGRIQIEILEPVGGVAAQLHTVRSHAPFTESVDLKFKIDGSIITIDDTLIENDAENTMRSVISISMWPVSGAGFGKFKLI